MAHQSLIAFASDAEDVAAGLRAFRDQLPRLATPITANISELFALSSVLREIHNAEGDVQFKTSFYRVQDDLNLLLRPSLRQTLDAAFDMFARSRERPHVVAWDELGHKMEDEEGVGLQERLEVYHDFLRAQADILQRRQPSNIQQLRRELITLWDAQRVSVLRAERRYIDSSAASTPRPGQHWSRPSVDRSNAPNSPISPSETWSDHIAFKGRPPFAPDPPYRFPTSPTLSSAQTFPSSQTSYSSDADRPMSPQFVHWSRDVFDGNYPTTTFARDFQIDLPSSCLGSADSSALQHLTRDGFIQALELPFDSEQVWLSLYFRPADSRARLLLIAPDSRGRQSYYCTPLTNVKLIRDLSSLQLCRARGDGRYSLWATLNFWHYERMVLFYCTFVAMKRQDSRMVPHDDLLDETELERNNDAAHEFQEFGGKVKDGHYLHAVRLYRDQSSGVVRLEASALRGPMKNVPLWTAFLTKYARDSDHVQLERGNVVSFAAIKPPPYVFLSGYVLPKNRDGEYILQFTSNDDAREFVETWTGLCRNGG